MKKTKNYPHVTNDLLCRQLALCIIMGSKEVRDYCSVNHWIWPQELRLGENYALMKFVAMRKDINGNESRSIAYIIRIFLVLHRLLSGRISPKGRILSNGFSGIGTIHYCPVCELEAFPKKLELVLSRKGDTKKALCLIERSLLRI